MKNPFKQVKKVTLGCQAEEALQQWGNYWITPLLGLPLESRSLKKKLDRAIIIITYMGREPDFRARHPPLNTLTKICVH